MSSSVALGSVLWVGLKLRGDHAFQRCCICLVCSPLVECLYSLASFVGALTKDGWPGQDDVHELLSGSCGVSGLETVEGCPECREFAPDL